MLFNACIDMLIEPPGKLAKFRPFKISLCVIHILSLFEIILTNAFLKQNRMSIIEIILPFLRFQYWEDLWCNPFIWKYRNLEYYGGKSFETIMYFCTRFFN
jgi:hypothetical protein